MVGMTQEMKTSLLEVIDFAASKLQIDSKSKLFLAVQEAIEQATVSEMETVSAENAPTDDSWLEAAKPVLRIHKTLQACISCEG
jgi:hypothetical protein